MSVNPNDLKLDLNNLAEESAAQASLYGYYSEELSKAEFKVSKAEDKYKLARAERLLELTRTPPADVKITVATMEALLDSDKTLLELKSTVYTLQSEVIGWKAGTRALEHKKSMIDNASRLWIANYFTTPHVTDENSAAGIRRSLNAKNSRNED